MLARFSLAFLLSMVTTPAVADLTNQNTPLCTALNEQIQPVIVSDGSGGAIVAWTDRRNGDYDVFARRISSTGAALWVDNGVPICTATKDQQFLAIVADGSGGAFISWSDARSGNVNIYAQRINGSGVVLWTTNGVKVTQGSGDKGSSLIVSDGSGGVIVGWTETPPNHSPLVVAQRLDGSGQSLWQTKGMTLCNAAGSRFLYDLRSDGAGGAIAAWQDGRFSPVVGVGDVFGQRVGPAGQMLWTPNGVQLSSGATAQVVKVVADGAGGGLFAWSLAVGSENDDLAARHVSAVGVPQAMIPLCTAPQEQAIADAISDGNGGAFILWNDDRDDPFGGNPTQDVFAQHLSASDTPLWAVDGVPVTQAGGFQAAGRIALDNSGGAWFGWYSHPFNAPPSQGSNGVLAQHLDAGGAPVSPPDTIATTFGEMVQIVANGSGGIIAAWHDARGTSLDIYAQVVPQPTVASMSAQRLAGSSPIASSASLGIRAIMPNPMRAEGSIDFVLPKAGMARLVLRDVQGRTVQVLKEGVFEGGQHHVAFKVGAQWLRPGIYWVELRSNGIGATRRLAVIP